MNAENWPCPNKTLKYDKGENRHKHAGNKNHAQMVQETGGHWVGKCPQGFSLEDAESLLQNGIPEFRNTTVERPFRIWAYFKGAIYVARPQDGITWHGFPNGHPMKEPPAQILRQLEQRALALGEEMNLKKWLQTRWNKNH